MVVRLIWMVIKMLIYTMLSYINIFLIHSMYNFVDLGGSERTSQSLSAGTRLKAGCHINRSLLTLGTVIRKLRLASFSIFLIMLIMILT